MTTKRTSEAVSRAVALAVTGKSGAEIATALRVSRRSVVRWLSDPALKPVIVKARRLHDARFWRDVRRKRNGMVREQMRTAPDRLAQ